LANLHWDVTEQAFFDHGLHTLQPRNQLAKRRFITDAFGYGVSVGIATSAVLTSVHAEGTLACFL
jgi:hypothetical protein